MKVLSIRSKRIKFAYKKQANLLLHVKMERFAYLLTKYPSALPTIKENIQISFNSSKEAS